MLSRRSALVLLPALLCGLVGILAALAAQPTNFALSENGGAVTGPNNSSKSAGKPPVINDGKFDGYAWAYLKTPVLIRFADPQTINTVAVLLHHERTAWYHFTVEISPDGKTWDKVGERTEGRPRGLQRVSFEPTECREVRITFTDTSIPARSYHIVEVGAYMLPDPKQPSPLKAEYEAWKKEGHRSHYEALLHFLGPNAQMTPEERERALKLPEGKRITKDLDGDGDPDLADYVDTDPKHTIRPMLVRALDDDDDMGADGEPDLDSDCYIADWRGDGRIEAAVDYWDEDGDGDADRMDIYCAAHAHWHVNKLEVVVIRDIGDDDMMWYTRNYRYDQGPCQWKSDFNGDEIFCMFFYDDSAREFIPFAECPFTHHDLDGDGVSEFTIQFLGQSLTLRSIRYSFDADNDNHPETNRRDYDFSLSCPGRLVVPPEKSTTATLRNGEQTRPYLDWPFARELAEAGDWKSCRLCWDEIDHNVNPANKIEKQWERWEGVGGYPMREGNKRWETDRDYSGKMQLYYWSFDRRIHLFGAETGFINIDHDHDYKVDANITYADEDGDGFFDAWSFDADADGKPERALKGLGGERKMIPVPFEYEDFVRMYRAWLQEATKANELLLPVLRRLAGPEGQSRTEHWWLNERPKSYYAAEKLGGSAEARRYYQDIIREELFLAARARCGDEAWWGEFEKAYARGAFERAAELAALRL